GRPLGRSRPAPPRAGARGRVTRGPGRDREPAQRPRARGAAAPRRASRNRRGRGAALHLRAHSALTREEPPAQAGRLVPPGGAFGSPSRAGSLKSPTVGDMDHPRLEAAKPDIQKDTVLL